MIVLKKTAPGDEFRMGALLIESLSRRGIAVRVDRPFHPLPETYLVAEAPGRPRVWIIAYGCNDERHYDISRGALMGLTATAFCEDRVTRLVFYGLGNDVNPRPVPQAEACADAVASFFFSNAR
ncbi:hypothetical protein ABZ916_25825 [Streptomyces sp. NPDC046853]|uniref:hypothetical protein n=1 Tax=Streptomyces sp. NPDC046853 TaxID=3154920 RepID=UPI0033D117E0